MFQCQIWDQNSFQLLLWIQKMHYFLQYSTLKYIWWSIFTFGCQSIAWYYFFGRPLYFSFVISNQMLRGDLLLFTSFTCCATRQNSAGPGVITRVGFQCYQIYSFLVNILFISAKFWNPSFKNFCSKSPFW